MNPQRDQILQELGLGPQWRLRQASADDAKAPAAPAAAPAVEVAGTAVPSRRRAAPATETAAPAAGAVDARNLDWDGLATAVAECRACGLCAARKQAVLGVGDRQADWLFVGEAPGAEED